MHRGHTGLVNCSHVLDRNMCLSHRPLCNSQVRAGLFIVQSTSLRKLAHVCSANFAPAMLTRYIGTGNYIFRANN